MNSVSAQPPAAHPALARKRLPHWLRRAASSGPGTARVERQLDSKRLVTVCREAKCPNRAECFARGTATFLVLGSVCTRHCAFCSVTHGVASAPDPDEPYRVALAAKELALSFVVVTSVTRDDLPDGGAGHIAAVVRAVREECPNAGIEVLVPDFLGSADALETVLIRAPDVFNHNVETVPRLYPRVRPEADYGRSLEVLACAAAHTPSVVVKSGIMVGFGEQPEEILAVMKDLRGAGCAIITIGQYLQPTDRELPVAEFVTPELFEMYEQKGRAMGFANVTAGPFVRSSYRACDSARSAGVQSAKE